MMALFSATALVAGFFAYIYTLKRQMYLLLWTLGWAFYSLHFLGPALWQWIPQTAIETGLSRWIYSLASVCFFLGAQMYSQRKPWIRPAIVAAVALGVWTVGNATKMVLPPVGVPSSILFLAIAVVFWQESRRQETLADRLLSISFAVWAALRIGITIAGPSTGDPQNIALRSISAVPSAFIAMLMVMAIYEEEKRRIERNMLALSNLNLATSSFVGGEIQRMLSQALDRVLSVVRLPCGVLFLHHGDPLGPTSVVAVGLNDEFCRQVQEEGLDDYLVGLVARLGGLLGFRDLRDDSLSALEKEPSIRRFREIAFGAGPAQRHRHQLAS